MPVATVVTVDRDNELCARCQQSTTQLMTLCCHANICITCTLAQMIDDERVTEFSCPVCSHSGERVLRRRKTRHFHCIIWMGSFVCIGYVLNVIVYIVTNGFFCP
jgi:hypothetical protein